MRHVIQFTTTITVSDNKSAKKEAQDDPFLSKVSYRKNEQFYCTKKTYQRGLDWRIFKDLKNTRQKSKKVPVLKFGEVIQNYQKKACINFYQNRKTSSRIFMVQALLIIRMKPCPQSVPLFGLKSTMGESIRPPDWLRSGS